MQPLSQDRQHTGTWCIQHSNVAMKHERLIYLDELLVFALFSNIDGDTNNTFSVRHPEPLLILATLAPNMMNTF
jgi:hypothetical protein